MFAWMMMAALVGGPAPDTVSVVATGDVMLGSMHPTPRLPARWEDVVGDAAPVLRRADFALGNLEGAITTHPSTTKSCARCYAFRMPPEAAVAVGWAGWDVMSVANNHARDFGAVGQQHTQELLAQQGVLSTGTAGVAPAIVVRGGRRIGVLAYAPNNGMRDVRDIAAMRQDVRALAGRVDHVVVTFHGGGEGTDRVRVRPGTEHYLGENRGDVVAFSHAAVEAGAHLVIGHGPHVPRALDMHQGKLIAYSLGNFSTYGGFGLSGPLGLAPALWVELKRDGTPACARVVSFHQTAPGGARVDPHNRAAELMMKLTMSDRPGAWAGVRAVLTAPCATDLTSS